MMLLNGSFLPGRWSRFSTLCRCFMAATLLRCLRAGLLRHHVRRVPVGPVFVALPAGALFVLAVRDRRTAHCARQIVRRRKSRRRRVNATGQPRRQLLEQPAVAVRILERREGAVATML